MRHLTFKVSDLVRCHDPRPLADAPMTNQIQQSVNNRIGAVYSALYNVGPPTMLPSRRADEPWERGATRRALLLLIEAATNILTNDLTSTPDQLLGTVLRHQASRGRDLTASPWAMGHRSLKRAVIDSKRSRGWQRCPWCSAFVDREKGRI